MEYSYGQFGLDHLRKSEEGLKLFNSGNYWDCHEALEPLWLQASSLDKQFLSGIILLAAALHKARAMNSPRGGRRNYAKALTHLAVIPDTFNRVYVRKLEALVHRALIEPTFRPQVPLSESV